MAWEIICEPDGTITRTEVPDEPDPVADALAAVEAADDFDALKAATVAYLSLLNP